MDSEATIEAALEALAANFNVDRVFWRGGQDEIWGETFEFRRQARRSWAAWDWGNHLLSDVGTNDIAVRSARKLGLGIWVTEALFDHGGQPEVSNPMVYEDRLRIDHPEWAPVNRYGTRRHNGIVALWYPEARAALVERYSRFMVDKGYDGIHFYTYTENWGLRYDDEFGYDPPIVEEFKRRYGVDILNEEFDAEAWGRLLGEHVTQFLKELKEALRPHNKKIAVFIDLGDSHLTQQWGDSRRTSGRIYMDWETWARDGIVDELVLNPRYESEEVGLREAGAVIDFVSKTECRVSYGSGRADPYAPMPSGVRTRVLSPLVTGSSYAEQPDSATLESAFGYDHRVGSSEEATTPQPSDALKGDDRNAKRRLLYRVYRGQQTVPLEEVITATRDEDVFVRRMSVRALAASGDTGAVPAIEAALLDVENSVRCQAVVALGQLNGPESLDRLFEAVARDVRNPQFLHVVAVPVIRKVCAQNVAALFARLESRQAPVRWAALLVLREIGGRDFPEGRAQLIRVATTDVNAYARELALAALARYGASADVITAMTAALQDREQTVQAHAAEALGEVVAGTDSPVGPGLSALEALTTLFREYGEGCLRSDVEWGWRSVGNAMLAFGAEGRKALEGLIEQKHDRRLAELAWRVVYIRHGRRERFGITPEEDREAHSHHPFLDLPL